LKLTPLGRRTSPDPLEYRAAHALIPPLRLINCSSGSQSGLHAAAYRSVLDALETDNGSVRVWQIDRKHEDAVRRAAGDKKYQELSQRYPNYTNATRHRLIAADPEMPVPEECTQIRQWLMPGTQKRNGDESKVLFRCYSDRNSLPALGVAFRTHPAGILPVQPDSGLRPAMDVMSGGKASARRRQSPGIPRP
jgi:hypothetical protein